MRWFLIILLFSALSFYGQNLIPNGSFEDTVSDCYYKVWVDPGMPDISNAKGWFSPNKGTPDLKAPNGSCPYTSTNFIGTGVDVHATEGNIYGAFYTYDTNQANNNYREYIGTKLSYELSDLNYCLELDIKLMPASMFASNVGVLITSDSISADSNFNLNYQPTIQFGSPYLDTSWKRISFEINASGNEKYIYFGNFLPDSLTDLSSNNGNYSFTFYCIDNLSLTLCPGQFENHFTVYPNPSNGNAIFIDHYSDTLSEVYLYNSLGQVVGYRQLSSGINEGEIFSNLSAGIYILRYQAATGYLEEEKVIVVK